jgi:integrase
MDPEQVRPADVRRWVIAQGDLAPSSLRQYLTVVRQVLDFVELPHPNPAKHPSVTLPRAPEHETQPPSWAEYKAISEHILARHLATLRLFERTGLRVGELSRLTWGDVDFAGQRLRVARGRTKSRTAGRRFVPLTPEILTLLNDLLAQEDRRHDGLVLRAFRESTFFQALGRACRDAGVAAVSPHDLRHRFISLLVLAGVPMPLVRDIAGHGKLSVTQDIYSHVLLDEPTWRLEELRRAVGTATGLGAPTLVVEVDG